MVSQSIFLMAIDFYDALGNPGPGREMGASDFVKLGFSPIAIILVIVMISVMIVLMVGIGFIPYARGMPFAASNSMAISAACHTVEVFEANEAVEGNNDAATRRIQWGVMRAADGDVPGHCGFSAEHVEAPVKGELYV
jgi:hypothetical protein